MAHADLGLRDRDGRALHPPTEDSRLAVRVRSAGDRFAAAGVQGRAASARRRRLAPIPVVDQRHPGKLRTTRKAFGLQASLQDAPSWHRCETFGVAKTTEPTDEPRKDRLEALVRIEDKVAEAAEAAADAAAHAVEATKAAEAASVARAAKKAKVATTARA